MADREFSAGGIVIKGKKDDLEVLLIKDGYGRWTWPKGKIDKGESAADAAIREVKEESGLASVKILKEVARVRYVYRREGKLIFKRVYVFVLSLVGDDTLKIQTEEIQAGQWLKPEEAINRVEYKGAAKILKKALTLFEKEVGNDKDKD